MNKINTSRKILRENTSELCDIGVKYAGTPGEVMARDHIMRKLEEYKLDDVYLEEFQYLHYMPEEAEFKLLSKLNNRSIECEPLQNSSNDEVESELIDAGNSNEELEELIDNGVNFEGKIILTKSPFPFVIYPKAEEVGASGIVIITDPPENLIRAGLGPNDRRRGKIPGITISENSGEILRRKLSENRVKVHMRSQGRYSERKSWNIVGEINGNDSTDEMIACCSHYDSQIKGEHAWDNVTGDSGLLEIARVLKERGTSRNVEILFFGVEELGFWGSNSFIEKHRRRVRDNYHSIVNLDGFSSKLCPENYLETTKDARDFALNIAGKMNWSVDYECEPMPLSDHVPFMEEKVSVIWIHEGLIDPYYHTEKDVLDNIDFNKLNEITGMAAQCVFELASREEIPFGG